VPVQKDRPGANARRGSDDSIPQSGSGRLHHRQKNFDPYAFSTMRRSARRGCGISHRRASGTDAEAKPAMVSGSGGGPRQGIAPERDCGFLRVDFDPMVRGADGYKIGSLQSRERLSEPFWLAGRFFRNTFLSPAGMRHPVRHNLVCDEAGLCRSGNEKGHRKPPSGTASFFTYQKGKPR